MKRTVLIGGALAMLASRGVRVHIVSATRGEGGEIDPERPQEERQLARGQHRVDVGPSARRHLGAPRLELRLDERHDVSGIGTIDLDAAKILEDKNLRYLHECDSIRRLHQCDAETGVARSFT